MNILDELFKNQLEDHSLSPTSASWAKVEANLSKKNKVLVWTRIAAGFLLFSLALGIYQTLKSVEDNQLAQVVNKSLNKLIEPTVTKHNAKSAIEKHVDLTKKKSVLNKEIEDELLTDQIVDSIQSTESIVSIANNNQGEIKQTEFANALVTEKPIVIEYVLEPIAEQPKNAYEEIEVTKSKTSLQKVVDFARDAKNGEGSLGLRQAKDDLFAFNFKKDKSKNSKN